MTLTDRLKRAFEAADPIGATEAASILHETILLVHAHFEEEPGAPDREYVAEAVAQSIDLTGHLFSPVTPS